MKYPRMLSFSVEKERWSTFGRSSRSIRIRGCCWFNTVIKNANLINCRFVYSRMSINYGPGVLGALGAVAGMYVNEHYRNRLRLGKFGYIGSTIPIVLLPAIMTTLYNRTFIQPRILLQSDQCPLCLQIKAAAVQCLLGTGYPALLAPLASYMVRCGTL